MVLSHINGAVKVETYISVSVLDFTIPYPEAIILHASLNATFEKSSKYERLLRNCLMNT